MHKQHFKFLDATRGIAAFLVAWLHASQIFGIHVRPVHATLAVDFFFCLSGFVIAYAYEEKLRTSLGLRSFLYKRLIRLYPMIFVGVSLGALSLFCSRSGSAAGASFDSREKILFFAAGLLLVPVGLLLGKEAYPVNNPVWSLFFEIVSNVLYGFFARGFRSGRKLDLSLLAASALLILCVAHAFKGVQTVGFSDFASFAAGFARVVFPFFSGVVIYRYKLFEKVSELPGTVLMASLFLALSLPLFGRSWVYDSAFILLFTPFFVAFGARARAPDNALHGFLGKMSYPFYVVHQPVLKMTYLLLGARHSQASAYLGSGVGLFSAGVLSFVLLTFYDEPVRAMLNTRITRRHDAQPAIS